jgi:hypothetical protein
MFEKRPNITKEEALKRACAENGFIYEPNGLPDGVERSYIVFENCGYNMMFSNTKNLIFVTKEELSDDEYLDVYRAIINNKGNQIVERNDSDAIFFLTLFTLDKKLRQFWIVLL